jgi:phosphate transport system substrate-binding protein
MRLALLAAASLALAACGQSSDKPKAQAAPAGAGQVWAAGSSTVFPFATRVAENVARTGGLTPAKVESLGTGGGFKLFCGGMGGGYPDVATASRPMKTSEWDNCQGAGVTDIIEIKIGYDGIVVANAKGGAVYDLTLDQIYRGLAADTAAGSGFAKNAAKSWAEVDPALPKDAIRVYGPPPTSGTRDAFLELAMEKGAGKSAVLKALKESDEDAFKARAHTIRQDGAWIDSGENDNAIVQTLTKTPGSLGVFGYSFLDENLDQVTAAKVEGVQPTLATISDGSYPLSRTLFIYVKKANVASKPALQAFMDAFVSDAASGKGGYLQDRGLIALPAAEREAQKQAVKALTTMSAPAS